MMISGLLRVSASVYPLPLLPPSTLSVPVVVSPFLIIMVCRHLMRRSVTSRHAVLLQFLVSFLRDAGLQPIPEARTENGEPFS